MQLACMQVADKVLSLVQQATNWISSYVVMLIVITSIFNTEGNIQNFAW